MQGLCLALSLSIALTACARRGRPPDERDTPESQALLTKLDGYLECHTDHSEAVFRIADTYRDRVALEPTATSAGIQASPDPTECLSRIAAAKTLPPSLPALEAAGDAFAAALARVHELTAKGDAQQSALLSAFSEFDVAQVALFDQVFLLNHDVHVKQLARKESREGRTLATIAEGARLQAEPLVRHAAIRFDELDRVDVPALSLDLATFEDAVALLRARADDNEEEADRLAGLHEILGASNELIVAAKQLRQRAVDKLSFTNTELLQLRTDPQARVPGAPGSMIAAYNRLAEFR